MSTGMARARNNLIRLFIGQYSISKTALQAQPCGDLEKHFRHWFDTHTGPKKSTESYTKIAEQLHSSPNKIWFVSDNGAECDSARSAGMHTLFSLRDGNPDRDPRDHTVVQSLREVNVHLRAEQ